MRPDHFTRPIQSDRMRQDYGHTRFSIPPEHRRGTIRRGLAWIIVCTVLFEVAKFALVALPN